MNKGRMSVLGAAVISAIALGTLAGCKSQEVLKDRPFVPPPAKDPALTPAVVQPAPVLPAPEPVKPILPLAPVEKPIEKPVKPAEEVVPK